MGWPDSSRPGRRCKASGETRKHVLSGPRYLSDLTCDTLGGSEPLQLTDLRVCGSLRTDLRTNTGGREAGSRPARADGKDHVGSTAGPAERNSPDGYPQAAGRRSIVKMTAPSAEIMVKPRCR
jgi:hypothetical protein